MSKRMKNKLVRRMIEDCINENYDQKVCEWRRGKLMRSDWACHEFKQGVFVWYGKIKGINQQQAN